MKENRPHDRRDEVSVGALTVLSSRTLGEDPPDDALVAAIRFRFGGHQVAEHDVFGGNRWSN